MPRSRKSRKSRLNSTYTARLVCSLTHSLAAKTERHTETWLGSFSSACCPRGCSQSTKKTSWCAWDTWGCRLGAGLWAGRMDMGLQAGYMGLQGGLSRRRGATTRPSGCRLGTWGCRLAVRGARLRPDHVDNVQALGTECAAEDGAEGVERRVGRHHDEDLVLVLEEHVHPAAAAEDVPGWGWGRGWGQGWGRDKGRGWGLMVEVRVGARVEVGDRVRVGG